MHHDLHQGAASPGLAEPALAKPRDDKSGARRPTRLGPPHKDEAPAAANGRGFNCKTDTVDCAEVAAPQQLQHGDESPVEPHVSTMPMVRFNHVFHPSEILVKQYRFQDNVVTKDMTKCGHIPVGCTVTTKTLALDEYVRAVHDGGFNQYALPSNADLGDDVPLGVRGFSGPGVDRTAKTMTFLAAEPAVVTFDHDPHPSAATSFIDPNELHELLASHFPGAFSGAARVAYYSSSSFLHLPGGAQFSQVKGFHVAYAVQDAGDIPRLRTALFKRLCLAGLGYIAVTRDGKMLPRTVFDQKVLEPQQPLFAGGALCHNGIEQRRPQPAVHAGSYLNSAAITTLTPAENEAYLKWEAEAKAAARPQAERVKRDYVNAEVAKLVDRGATEPRARRAVESRLAGELIGNDLLHFANFGAVTVAEVLADPAKFNEQNLYDPVEPEYGGPTTAIFYANESNGDPTVFSHAHGGRTFMVRHDEVSLVARLQALPPDDVAASWCRLTVAARLQPDASERVIKEVKAKTGTGIKALRDTLKAAQKLAAANSSTSRDPAMVMAEDVLAGWYDGGTRLTSTEGGSLWKYTGTHWTQLPKSVLERQIQELVEPRWGEVRALYENLEKKLPEMSAFVGSVVRAIERMTVQEGDPMHLVTERPNVINMANGELWLESEGPVLRPHLPQSYLTSCSGIKYDPDATAPGFEKALRGMLCEPGGRPFADQDEMVRHIGEMLGYVIQTGRFLKVFILITGPGDNGKTCLTKLLELILGQDAITFDRLSGVNGDGNRFASHRLVGKQVLIDDDADYEYLLPDGFLKKICESKPMTAEPKFAGAFTFVARVVPVILSNSYPRTRDLSRGMRTRAQVLNFPRQFKRPSECAAEDPDVQRPEAWGDVYQNELPGVVNVLVAAFYRLKGRGAFLPPPSAEAAFDAWLSEANVVSRFIADACESIVGDAAKTPVLTTSTLHRAFLHWAERNGVQPIHRPQMNQFKGRLTDLGHKVGHIRAGTAVYGLALKDERAEMFRDIGRESENDSTKDVLDEIKLERVIRDDPALA